MVTDCSAVSYKQSPPLRADGSGDCCLYELIPKRVCQKPHPAGYIGQNQLIGRHILWTYLFGGSGTLI